MVKNIQDNVLVGGARTGALSFKFYFHLIFDFRFGALTELQSTLNVAWRKYVLGFRSPLRFKGTTNILQF